MRLTKYVPLNPTDTVFDRLNWGFPLIDRFLGDTADASEKEEWSALRLPRTNVHETDGAFEFVMEMPGIGKDDVEVQIEGDHLIVKAETETKKEEKNLIRREYRSARFERSFTVGNEIDADKIVAKMENGVLTVTLPKKAEKVGRKVQIS